MKKKRKTDRSRPDHYAKKAKKDHFPARSVYKLEEIQKKFRVIRPKDRVLDLGCAPGSWLKYVADIAGAGGKVVGVDLKDVDTRDLPESVLFCKGDILSLAEAFSGELDGELAGELAGADSQWQAGEPDIEGVDEPGGEAEDDENDVARAALREAVDGEYDVVLSDMAPNTTGIRSVDAARSFVLAEAALQIANRMLAPGGSFVVKIFQGDDFDGFIRTIKEQYRSRKIYKPQSTRKESKEIYVIGIGKKEKGKKWPDTASGRI